MCAGVYRGVWGIEGVYIQMCAGYTGVYSIRRCVGAYIQRCVGVTEVCTGYTGVCTGYTEVCMGYTGVCMGYTGVCMGYTGVCRLTVRQLVDSRAQGMEVGVPHGVSGSRSVSRLKLE